MTPAERQYLGSRVQKLGVKTGMRVLVAHIEDPAFNAELRAAGAEILGAGELGAGDTGADVAFVGVDAVGDLGRIATYKPRISKQGALWLVRPKGRDTAVPEAAAMTAGLESGLVDVKVVSFSGTHSALKYVYRLRDR